MASTCDKCGAHLEAGTLFCSQCSAPQIRVSVPPGTASTSPQQEQPAEPPSHTDLTQPANKLRWLDALPLALSMGTAAALLSLAPFVQIFFLAWMFGAGWMSVRAYARRTGTWLTGGMGARLGAATGAIAAVIYNVMLVLAIRLGDYGAVLRAELERQINTISATASAEDAARLREIFLSPDGLAIIVTATVALMFALFVLLALLGGMLGAHASRRQSRT